MTPNGWRFPSIGQLARFGTKPAVATLWLICCMAQKLLWFDHACNTGCVLEHIRRGFRSGIRCPGSHLTPASKIIPALDGLRRLALARHASMQGFAEAKGFAKTTAPPR
jgi:hypothetical protein